MTPLTLVFLGLPLAAVLLQRDGHRIAYAGLSRRHQPGERALRRTVHDVELIPSLDDARLVEHLRSLRADLVVSWFWTQRIPPAVYGACRLGGINAHPSLLPRHRGPDPTTWAILEGDRTTGVTVHRLRAAYDTGPILFQHEVPIDDSWTGWQLARALDGPSLRMTRAAVCALASGSVHEREQSELGATEAPFLTDAESELDWRQPATVICRKIRALAPVPGAWVALAGEVVAIEAARLGPFIEGFAPPAAGVFQGRVLFAAADRAVVIERVELNGQTVEGEALAAQLGPLLVAHCTDA